MKIVLTKKKNHQMKQKLRIKENNKDKFM